MTMWLRPGNRTASANLRNVRSVCSGIVLNGKARECGIDADTGKVLIRIDPVYYRPLEVEALLGDASKAERLLHWKPAVTFEKLVEIMVESDLRLVRGGKQGAC